MPAHLTLQFSATPARLSALQRKMRVLSGQVTQPVSATRVFLDTPGHDIHQQGFSLHLERDAGQWVQCLAHTGGGTGASGALVEFVERKPYAGAFSLTGLAERVPLKLKTLRKVAPVFDVRQRRNTWVLTSRNGAPIECIFDRGWVLAGEIKAPFARLQLNSPGDARDELVELAAALCATVPLVPALVPVSAQGYEMLSAYPAPPVKAVSPDLNEDASAAQAFRHIARACFSHLSANRDGAIERAHDPEYVHQLRVAVRRLRAAMQVFKRVIPDDFVETAIPVLRELMATLGRTRDLDVLIQDIVFPVESALPDEPRLHDLNKCLADQLLGARQAAAQLLEQPEHLRQMLRLSVAIDRLGSPPVEETVDDFSLREFADQRLRKRLHSAQLHARLARKDDPESLHRLRIAIKRLRYGLEFFSSLLPGKTGRQVLKRLAVLQEELGQLNDLASAGALLMASAGDDASLREAVTLVGGWHGSRYAALLKDIPHHLDSVEKLRLPRLAPKRKKNEPAKSGDVMMETPVTTSVEGAPAHAPVVAEVPSHGD